jgi:hypothetical protein
MQWAETFGTPWMRKQFTESIEIHFKNIQSDLGSTKRKFLWLFSEPACYCLPESVLETQYDRFSLILTHKKYHLKKYPNAILCPWVDTSTGVMNIDPEEPKKFLLSGLLSGNARGAPGHQLRYKLFEQLDPRHPDHQLYVSTRSIDGSFIINNPIWSEYKFPFPDRVPLFKACFNIAIENSIEDGYNSEKLIDPIVGSTIPIYYGNYEIPWCDERGLLRALNVSEFEDIIRELSVPLYKKMLPYAQRNRSEAIRNMWKTHYGYDVIQKFLADQSNKSE